MCIPTTTGKKHQSTGSAWKKPTSSRPQEPEHKSQASAPFYNFPRIQRGQKIELGGDRGRPIALVVKPIICGFRVIKQLYINLILLLILLIITIIT